MTDHLQFLLLGLGNGAVYGALAIALVLAYRSSGVINFAAPSIALFAAYVYAFLRADGELIVLVPGLPSTVDLGPAFATIPAMLAALLAASLLGLLIYLVPFRLLRHAPPIASAVASLGVMLLLQGLMAARVGSKPVKVGPIFPDDIYSIGDIRLPADRLWFLATIVVLAVLIGVVLRSTRFGLSTQAAAETEVGAVLCGLSPNRIAGANWMLSSALAGVAGILIAPIVPLFPASYALFIVPALAAALIGGFNSLVLATVGGIAIGMLQSQAVYVQTTSSWAPSSGFGELIVLVILLLVLLARSKALPVRGTVLQESVGQVPYPRTLRVPAAAATALAAVGIVALDGSWRAALLTSLIMSIVTLSIVVVTGYAGQVSLVQLTLAGAAGFLLSKLTTDWGVPFPVAPLLAALGAAIIGFVVGLPAVRIRGLSLGIVTLALAVALDAVWFRNNSLNGGLSGATIEGPSLFGIDLSPGAGAAFPRIQFGFLCLGVLLVVSLAVAKLRTSSLGSKMVALKANERSAAASGVDVARTKLIAFTIGAFIAGLGGAFLAYFRTVVSAESYGILSGLALFAAVYLAGITSVAGGLLAGLLVAGGLNFVVLDRLFEFGRWYEVIAALLLIVTVVGNPEGLVKPGHDLASWWRRRHARASAPERRSNIDSVAEATASLAGAEQIADHMTQGLAPQTTTILEARSITVSYGGVTAVDDVSFSLRSGAILGIIGPNGAGKTSLIDALTGFADSRGVVTLAGRPLAGMPPHERVRHGLARTFQSAELYESLTVMENVAVGEVVGRRRAPDSPNLDELFDTLGLRDVRDRRVSELSHGQRQMVSVARSLATRPDVVLLDEPAAGLDTGESEWLAQRLRAIRAGGVAIILVDHDMGLVLSVCDEVLVLDFGRMIAHGSPDAVRSNPKVAEAYLGVIDEAVVAS